jgi:hypothetical protein
VLLEENSCFKEFIVGLFEKGVSGDDDSKKTL